MNNMPEEKIGIVAVSRNCFPMSLSENRRKAVVKAYTGKYGEIYECPVCVENEIHMRNALADLKKAGCNALVVYLGNFGPESAETLLIKEFDGPAMVVAAAELQLKAQKLKGVHSGISGWHGRRMCRHDS